MAEPSPFSAMIEGGDDYPIEHGWYRGTAEPIRYGAQRDQFIDALIRRAARHPDFWQDLGELAVAIMKDRAGNG